MHVHPLHPATSHHPSRSALRDLLTLLSACLHSVMLAAGLVVRFVTLTVLACLFLSAPISLREVTHASHRPSSRQ